MESKHLIYKNGHFYDRNTRKRIEIADGSELTVVTAYSSFIEPEEVGSWGKGQPHDKDALKQKLENDPDVKDHKKILDKDTQLYFTITHSGKKYEFEVLLSEDLYVYLNHSNKKESNEGKLYDCACKVTKCMSGNILFFEPVKGKSLN